MRSLQDFFMLQATKRRKSRKIIVFSCKADSLYEEIIFIIIICYTHGA